MYEMNVRKPESSIKISKEELYSYSKEELIDRFIRLQEHNIQLRNILSKSESNSSQKTKQTKKDRFFDFSKCSKKHILLKFLYLGWDYCGYAVVEGTTNTVEHQIIQALLKCHLIESRETANYQRCGRTDKGVSSFSQVVSVTVRAANQGGPEIDYCGVLNRLLPPEIRVTGWSVVPSDFSARFDCEKRTYKYYFPRGNLNIEAMNKGAQYFVGVHDFRNFCKMDVSNGVTNFEREIISSSISPLCCLQKDDGYDMMEFTLVGRAFIWHQVRFIMAVLIMIGEGLEKPSVIQDLLDIKSNSRKPQYQMASHIGLCLFATEFEADWLISQAELTSVVSKLQSLWTTASIKATQVKKMLDVLENNLEQKVVHQSHTILRKDAKIHKPLLLRNTCNSFEEKVENYRKKFKFDEEQKPEKTASEMDINT